MSGVRICPASASRISSVDTPTRIVPSSALPSSSGLLRYSNDLPPRRVDRPRLRHRALGEQRVEVVDRLGENLADAGRVAVRDDQPGGIDDGGVHHVVGVELAAWRIDARPASARSASVVSPPAAHDLEHAGA